MLLNLLGCVRDAALVNPWGTIPEMPGLYRSQPLSLVFAKVGDVADFVTLKG